MSLCTKEKLPDDVADGSFAIDTKAMRCSPFFRTLPAAALASKCAEHERIVRQYGSNHPRAQALEESLSGLERAEAQAARVMEMAQCQTSHFTVSFPTKRENRYRI
jgi:hypothetical protein